MTAPSPWRWLCSVALCAVIIALSGGEQPQVPTPGIPHFDKVIHFFVFGLIATAWLRCFDLRRHALRATVFAIVLTSGFGLMDELWQGLNPHRYMELGDWIADTLGAVVAVYAYRQWPLYRRILEWPITGKRPPSQNP